jgi:methylated-DNA-[protein]-cysteine S-methyltransferase
MLLVFDETRRWLDLYFTGEKPDFTPQLAPKGTPFQQRVWEILLTIPYGKTVSYGDVARQISPTMSAQAIGGAVGRNPIGIIIPCHRVIGADGSLTGYGGGLERKRWLLELENKELR